LFDLLRHAPVIAPIGVQRQPRLTERLLRLLWRQVLRTSGGKIFPKIMTVAVLGLGRVREAIGEKQTGIDRRQPALGNTS
jgi:hypothetical protein